MFTKYHGKKSPSPQNGMASIRLRLLFPSGEFDESESYLRFLGELVTTRLILSHMDSSSNFFFHAACAFAIVLPIATSWRWINGGTGVPSIILDH